MEIKTLALGDIAVNCYLVSTDRAAIVIDPGYTSVEAENFLNSNKEKDRMILLTHGHFDHIGGANELREKTGVKIAIGEKETEYLSDPGLNLSSVFGPEIRPFSADVLLADSIVLTVGDIDIKVIHTPGHTVGGVSYLINDVLFSGDSLFYESIGRTDFPGGSIFTLISSVNKLLKLGDGIRVYPGHENATDILHEKRFNPYLR